MSVHEPQTSRSTEEMLDHLCYLIATEGERFYPPDDTAEQCLDSVEDPDEHQKGFEHGEHFRAYVNACDRFEVMRASGFEPRARAERVIERGRENGSDVPDIDWEWVDGGFGDE